MFFYIYFLYNILYNFMFCIYCIKNIYKKILFCVLLHNRQKTLLFSIDNFNLFVPLYILYNFFIFFYTIFTKIKKNIAQKNCIVFVQFYILLNQ